MLINWSGGLKDLNFFLGGGDSVKRGEVNISGWGWYPRGHYGKVKLIYTFFMSQTLVLSIKHATVNSIPYFGVSTVIMLSHRYFQQVVEVGLWTLACKQQVYFSCCLTLLTIAVSHEVKCSKYRCRNFNHQTYYINPYRNQIWQFRFVLSLC